MKYGEKEIFSTATHKKQPLFCGTFVKYFFLNSLNPGTHVIGEVLEGDVLPLDLLLLVVLFPLSVTSRVTSVGIFAGCAFFGILLFTGGYSCKINTINQITMLITNSLVVSILIFTRGE